MEANRVLAGRLIAQAYKKYKDTLRIDRIDPRCLFYLWDIIRFRVKATEAVWVLNGQLIFRGIPAWEDLERALDKAVADNACDIKE